MSNLQPPYAPTTYFDQQNGLYGNHFRFVLDALPDLTFFAQSITIPSLTSGPINRPTPFVNIREVGDHLNYSNFTVSYYVDGAFKTYSSLYWWLKGYGFPHSYDEVLSFRETRTKRVAMPNPQVKDLEKTLATLYVLQPDTEKVIAEFQFLDVVPTGLSDLQFNTTDSDAPLLRTTITFECTAFELVIA